MAFGYTKNEFEKKSTRERYRIERAELYFRKKAGKTPFIYFGLALLIGLYAYWGGGPLHFVAAALFAGLGVWQFFYVSRANVSTEEVDWRMRSLWESMDLETDALNRSDMDYDAFVNAPKILVYGYTKLPIGEKEALLRADSRDKAGRSSHVQFSCFTLAETSLECYSIVKSLLGEEKEETLMEWPYSRIREIELEKIAADCAAEAGGSATQMRHLSAVTVRSANKRENRSYAICEDCRENAQELVRRVKENQARKQIEEKTERE